MTGFLLFFNGVLLGSRSKQNKHVILSTTEAEHVSISYVSTEILFVKDILEFVGINVDLPIIVKVDNTGAIFLINNKKLGERTKHISTRYHFIRECVEDGILKIIYIKSEDNTSDIMTKNTGKETFMKHAKKSWHIKLHIKMKEDVNIKGLILNVETDQKGITYFYGPVHNSSGDHEMLLSNGT